MEIDRLRSNRRRMGVAWFLALVILLLGSADVAAQQFNTDNWWVLSHKMGMATLTAGEQYSAMYLGYGFLPGIEVDVAATLYEEDEDTSTAAHYSTTIYLKWRALENEAATSGVSVMAGTGQGPAYIEFGQRVQDFRNYWVAVPVTLPLFGNTILWDLMPGGTWNREYGPQEEHASGFTYSSRVAIYRIIPQSAIVFDVFGAEGDAEAPAQYKAGVRWESKYVVAALTYGDGLEGNEGGGIEFGLMFLTPLFE